MYQLSSIDDGVTGGGGGGSGGPVVVVVVQGVVKAWVLHWFVK